MSEVLLKPSKLRKKIMFEKTQDCFRKYTNYMFVSINKVKSNQYKDIISAFGDDVKVLCSKNKVAKKALMELDSQKYSTVCDRLRGNILIVFFRDTDPKDLLRIFSNNRRKAYAVYGDIAEEDIVIPAGITEVPPGKISMFQSLSIGTKITKNKIEIVNNHILVPAGKEVGVSEVAILKLLDIMPFEFGFEIIEVAEDGEFYKKDVLEISKDDIETSIRSSISEIAAISLGTGVLNDASLPYEISSGLSEIRKIGLAVGIDI